MQIQSKYGKHCLIILTLLALAVATTLLIYSGHLETIINFIKTKLTNTKSKK